MNSNNPCGIAGTFSFEMLPQHVDWLIDQRSATPDQATLINVSITMFATMTLEGALEYTFRSYLRKQHGCGWHEMPSASLLDRMYS